jgi:hypothetical protein
MSEITPRLTFDPEGILELRKTFSGEYEDRKLFTHQEIVDCLPGYDVRESETDTIIRVEVERVLGAQRRDEHRTASAGLLIRNLQPFLYFDYDEGRDGFFSLDMWGEHGAIGVIFPQFQRWLNAGGLSEEAAQHCISSMALPFHTDVYDEARKDFSYRSDGVNAKAGLGGFTLGVISRRAQFGITVAEDSGYKHGQVEWNWFDLTTIGNCACWGVDGMERTHVHFDQDASRLYEMGPHNVDIYEQSLSLTLGAAALAYFSVQYEGTEDILAHAEWRESRF